MMGVAPLEADHHALIGGFEDDREMVLAEDDGALALEAHGVDRIHLPGNLTLALVADMVDRGSDGCKIMRGLTNSNGGREPVGIFLGDEAGR